MTRQSPTELLRRHAVERRLRVGVRSANLDKDPNSVVPRMSAAQFADSCLLVQGVPDLVLDMLGVWLCESAGSTWEVDVVEIRGQATDVPTQQVAVRLSLREAAERCGLLLNHVEARALHREAVETVTENLVRRAARAEGAAA